MPSTVVGTDGDGVGRCWLNRYSATKITARAATVMPTGSSHGGRADRFRTGGRRGGCVPRAASGRCPGRVGAAVRFLLMARLSILHAGGRRAPENRLMTDGNELCFTPARELARRIRA